MGRFWYCRWHKGGFPASCIYTLCLYPFQPYTEYFPRANIHELITPDLLHQLIKGTFKDHLLEWVLDYIEAKYKGRDKQRRLRQLDLRCVNPDLTFIPD